ncbi:DUF4185 domain-containing protein [Pelagibacterium halotolerans]|uniref:DUF4185 domain-containing protein n=1 Tax=Pelagibacterium halotolerans TaxID=531813 RepID=UPI00384FE233
MARNLLAALVCVAFSSFSVIAFADPTTELSSIETPDGLSPDQPMVDGETAMPPLTVSVTRSEIVNQITGGGGVTPTAGQWDIHGTDLGHMFFHKDALYMVFGDTFGPRGLFGRRNWRSNTMARIADPDPQNGLPIETMITGADGQARELIQSRKIDGLEKTVIPTHGVSIGDRIYLHYMSVRTWGRPGRWEVGHSGIAYSDDDGQSWVVPSGAVQAQPIGFEQVAFVRDGDILYSLGIPEGRFGGAKLRRVATDQILARNAYEYWTGTEWVSDPAAARVIVPAPVGELSVAWSEAHGCWIMMYFDPERNAIVLRLASELTGPWTDAQVVVTAQDYPGLYAPYIVPGSAIDTSLYYTMSQWGPYNVFLMRTTLEWPAPPVTVAEGSTSDDG